MKAKLLIYVLWIFVGGALIISCKSSKPLTQQTPTVVYPAPPDTARIQFLTQLNNSEKITGGQTSFSKLIFGEIKPKEIFKPYGVQVKNGKLYICDTDLKGLEIIDFENQTFDYFLPEGKGALKLPLNCFIDESGFLYIADGLRKQIVVFNQNLEYVNAFGLSGEYKPTDVSVKNEKVWVTDIKNNKVDVFEQKLPNKHLFSFSGGESGEESRLYQATNIFVSNNKVYVTDFGEFKIKIYDQKGNYLSSVGSYGRGLGQFVRPKGIAVDKNENLFVVDAGFENVQIFNKNAELLLFFGGNTGTRGGMYLPAGIDVDYDNLKYFEKYVDKEYKLKYLIFVSNQYGANKINVYGAVELKN